MNNNRDRNQDSLQSLSRRKALLAAAAGVGLAILPGTNALAASDAEFSLSSIAMGFCPHPEGVEFDDVVLCDACSAGSERGAYELRVVGASTHVPMAIAAHYSADAEHRFWQAWAERGLLQRSPLSRIRWSAQAGDALPLSVRVGASQGLAQVAAKAGMYAMVAVPAAQPRLAWRSLALRAHCADGVAMRLVSRSSGADLSYPHALFCVREAGALQRI